MSLQWSHQNIVTRHQGTMRQSRLRHKMRDEESLETGFAFCWVAVQQTQSRGWKNCLLFSTILISESASNNPSLVFVINSKSLIYIFQLLDVWICSEERREAWVQAADSGGRGQRGEERRNRLKFPQLTTQITNTQPAVPSSQQRWTFFSRHPSVSSVLQRDGWCAKLSSQSSITPGVTETGNCTRNTEPELGESKNWQM